MVYKETWTIMTGYLPYNSILYNKNHHFIHFEILNLTYLKNNRHFSFMFSCCMQCSILIFFLFRVEISLIKTIFILYNRKVICIDKRLFSHDFYIWVKSNCTTTNIKYFFTCFIRGVSLRRNQAWIFLISFEWF